MDVVKIAFQAAQKITANEFRAVYGSNEPGRIMSAVTQIGDILYPQLAERMPGIIPVGDNRQGGIFFDGMGGIYLATIDDATQRCLGETPADIGGNFVNRNRVFKSALTAVW